MNRHSFSRRTLSITGLLILTLLLSFTGRSVVAQDASSGSGSMSCATAIGIGSEGDACISVVHSSPDAPLVDIYVDGERALSGLGFGWWSNWIAIPAGEHRVQVTASGTPADAAVIDATVELEAGMAYQVAATGLVADIAPQIYNADFSTLEGETARVRVVHTVPDAPAVDIAIMNGDVLVSGLEFPNSSDYLEVPAGTYDLEVRIAGTEDVVLPLPGVELSGGTVYDVYAIGTAGNGQIFPFVIPTTLVSTDMTMSSGDACGIVLGIGEEADACVNVIHASPDAPAVDIWVNGQVALSNVSFGEFSGWVALPAGEYQIQVTPTGQGADAAVIDAAVTVEAGVAYHIAATGTVAEIAPQIYAADLSQAGENNARIRVIHTSPDAPAVDIAVTGGDVLVPGLTFPNASGFLEVPAGTYDLEVRAAGTMDVALALPGVTLEAGMAYDVFAIGQLSDGTLSVLVIPSMTAHGE